MPEIPKIVRERLKAPESAQNHPDPDLLAAFAEKSLSERERTNVLEHIARCGDCREVIALALRASEEVAPQILPRRSSWLTWPALRWGFAAAGVVLVASLGIVKYQRSSSRTEISYKAAQQPKAPRTEAKAEVPAPFATNEDKERGFANNASTPTANAPAPAPKPVAPAEVKRDDFGLRAPSRVAGAVGGTLVSSGPRSTLKQQVAGQVPADAQAP